MYHITVDGIYIYDDSRSNMEQLIVIDPRLTLSDNSAGSLQITLPKINNGYQYVTRMNSTVTVYKDDSVLWQGRPLDESIDFWNNKTFMCEGCLAYLNDTIQPKRTFRGTIRDLISTVLDIHNAKKADELFGDRIIELGSVIVDDQNVYDWEIDYETSLTILNDLILNTFGGHFVITYTKDNHFHRFLNYYSKPINRNTQHITFGENLLDFTRRWEMTDFVTAVTPLGATIEGSETDERVTIESVNSGSKTLVSDSAKKYGYYEKLLDLPDISDPRNLKELATLYLSNVQFDNMVVELSAVDLHNFDVNVEALHLLDEVELISNPHGMDKVFPITQIDLYLDQPDRSTFVLGTEVNIGLTGTNNSVNAEILEEIKRIPGKDEILEAAKQNASNIINNATNGFITITKDTNGTNELYISNTADYTKASKYWRWNINGLGYFDKTNPKFNDPTDLKLALTMDGGIVADFITTGHMNAKIVDTGLLKDPNNNTTFNLDTGEFTMNKGSINLGEGNFVVDSLGNVSMVGGISIGGNIVWNSSNTPCRAVYSRNSIAKPVDGTVYTAFPESSATEWHTLLDIHDYYVSYTYDGGTTWTETVVARGKDGRDGIDGHDGANGLPGKDGTSQYTHVAYANSADGSKDFSTTVSVGKSYIGIFVDDVVSDSQTYSDYKWSLFKGLDGANGIPGKNGINGKTSYLHIAYANSSDGSSGFSTTDSAGKYYLGQYTDYTLGDSSNYRDYSWSRIRGYNGANGTNGKDGKDGTNGKDAVVDYNSVFNALTNNGNTKGCFTANGSDLYINADYIQGGIFKSTDGRSELEINSSGISYGTQNYYGQHISTWKLEDDGGSLSIWSSYGQVEISAINGLLLGRATGSSRDGIYVKSGGAVDAGWKCYADTIAYEQLSQQASDRRVKTDISYDFNKYEQFFMNLHPAHYLMKRHKEDGTNFGFIAQDVEQALHDTGLTKSDFAGLGIEDIQNEVRPEIYNECGIYDKVYGLHYNQFISLNTHMIQKLFRKVEALEQELTILKGGNV